MGRLSPVYCLTQLDCLGSLEQCRACNERRLQVSFSHCKRILELSDDCD